MSDYLIMKAVEHDKLPVKFKKRFPSVASLAAAGWWTQKKYDGCMGIAMMSQTDKCRMLSRTGEVYTPSCQHILDEIAEAATEQSESWDDFIVIGEVWQPITEAKFPAISGKFRRRAASPELRFVANDLLGPGMDTSTPYRLRFADLCELLPQMDSANVNVAETYHTESDPAARALEWQGAGGYDGAILRDPDSGYTIGTVKAGEIVKVKPVMSLDLAVTAICTTTGEKTGRAVHTITVMYKGVQTTVGSGVPHELTGFHKFGTIVEIECLGITADGKLREPRFKGVRFDKTQPD